MFPWNDRWSGDGKRAEVIENNGEFVCNRRNSREGQRGREDEKKAQELQSTCQGWGACSLKGTAGSVSCLWSTHPCFPSWWALPTPWSALLLSPSPTPHAIPYHEDTKRTERIREGDRVVAFSLSHALQCITASTQPCVDLSQIHNYNKNNAIRCTGCNVSLHPHLALR